jgi:type IV pilus assembly protein PilM
VHRGGLARTETICFAIARDAVMRYVDLLNKCKLDVVGVHTEVQAMVRAFDHIHHGPDDETTTTLFVDMGYGGTKVAITHGRRLTFARCIQLGGRTFDALIAEKLHCDMGSAKAHRISLGSALKRRWPEPSETGSAIVRAGAAHATAGARSASGAGTAAATVEPRAAKSASRRATGRSAPLGDAVDVDFTELIESLSDEVSMCLRYHQSLFPGRSIDRMVFVGGESRHTSMCRDIARVLELTAQLGDPLSRLGGIGSARAIGLTLGQPQPGWAVAYGLCASPSDE